MCDLVLGAPDLELLLHLLYPEGRRQTDIQLPGAEGRFAGRDFDDLEQRHAVEVGEAARVDVIGWIPLEVHHLIAYEAILSRDTGPGPVLRLEHSQVSPVLL